MLKIMDQIHGKTYITYQAKKSLNIADTEVNSVSNKLNGFINNLPSSSFSIFLLHQRPGSCPHEPKRY